MNTDMLFFKDKWVQKYMYTRINGYRDAFI